MLGLLIPLGLLRLDMGPVPSSRLRLAAGAARKGKGPWGHPLRLLHPSPHDLLQDPTRNQLLTSPSRGTPGAQLLGVGACRPDRGPQNPQMEAKAGE